MPPSVAPSQYPRGADAGPGVAASAAGGRLTRVVAAMVMIPKRVPPTRAVARPAAAFRREGGRRDMAPTLPGPARREMSGLPGRGDAALEATGQLERLDRRGAVNLSRSRGVGELLGGLHQLSLQRFDQRLQAVRVRLPMLHQRSLPLLNQLGQLEFEPERMVRQSRVLHLCVIPGRSRNYPSAMASRQSSRNSCAPTSPSSSMAQAARMAAS